jgi:hypothetical protein
VASTLYVAADRSDRFIARQLMTRRAFHDLAER